MNKGCLIFGGLVADEYLEIDKWPDRSQDGFILGEKTVPGGCALNMAVTAENLGETAYIVSCVGADETGRKLTGYLSEHELSGRYIMETPEASGKCLVFIEPDGERTFLTRKGAEERFPEELADRILQDSFGAASVTGYYLLNKESDRVVSVVEELRKRGTRILFDPSPLVGHIDKDLLRRILAVSDIITPNVTELNIIFRENEEPSSPSEGILPKAAQDFAEGAVLIVKDGARGGNVFTAEGSFHYDAHKCQAVDTTGAGDSFAGALLYAMTDNMDLAKAVDLAAACAAKTATIMGPHGFWKMEV